MTNAQGRVGVVMPHGVLFRGGAEGKIRRGIVEADLFEAVIGLAPNLFFGASIPVAICVLNRNKPAERRGKVLFVDAAQPGYFRAERAQNFLDEKHIASIVAAYRAYEDVERFAHVADLAEIEDNDFNLNIQPLRGHHRAGGGDERRRGAGTTAGGRAPPRRGHGPHGRAAGGAGVRAVGW